MFKSVKYSAIYAAQYLAMMAIGAAGIVLYGKLVSPSAQTIAILANSFSTIVILLSLAMTLTIYTYYGNIAMSMGATRSNFFISQQIIKLLYSAILCVMCVLSGYLFHFTLGAQLPSFRPIDIVMMFVTMLFANTLGELLGLISMRFGKVGMWIYIAVCMVFGGFVGFGFSMGSDFMTGVLASLLALALNNGFIILGVGLLASALITAFDYKLSRRLIVR